MVAIAIDRTKYAGSKGEKSWLDKFFEDQVKEKVETVKTVKEKEIKSSSLQIVPAKLFALPENNGFNFPTIRTQVEAGHQGAIGRARMILAGNLKRLIAKGEKALKDVAGDEVEQDEAFLAYKASLVVTAPAAAEAA